MLLSGKREVVNSPLRTWGLFFWLILVSSVVAPASHFYDEIPDEKFHASSFNSAIDSLEVLCPGDTVIPPCLPRPIMERIFEQWLDGFIYSGGCSVQVEFVGGVPELPHYCGDSVEVYFRAMDLEGCYPEATCSAVFKVERVQELTLICPDNYLIEECLSQREIDSIFADWLDQFTYSGSCAKEAEFIGGIPDPPRACGETVEVTYKIPNTRSCFKFQTCTKTFAVSKGTWGVVGDTSDLVLGCNEPFPPAAILSGVDRCGVPINFLFSEDIYLDQSTCTETLTRSWETIYGCAESVRVTQNVMRPVDSDLPDLGLSLDEKIFIEFDEVILPEPFFPNDNCGISSFGVEDDTLFVQSEIGPIISQILRVYYAVDECGNTNSFTQTIEVDNSMSFRFINPPADLCDPPLSVIQFLQHEISPLDVINSLTGEITSSTEPELSYDCDLSRYELVWRIRDHCDDCETHTQRICIDKPVPSCQIMEVEQESCGGISKYTLLISGVIPPYSIQWEVTSPGWSIEEGENRAEVYLRTGTTSAQVKATIRDANGCLAICSDSLTCVPIEGYVIEEKALLGGREKTMNKYTPTGRNAMVIAPNPVSGNLRIQLNSVTEETGSIVIRDQYGKSRERFKVRLTRGENQFVVPLQDLDDGVFIIQYVNKNRFEAQKFMKI